MAYDVDGMRFSYDYEELINELKSDLEEGLIKESSIIGIVREEDERLQGYKPIVDYYYPCPPLDINVPLEMIHNREEFTPEEWEQMKQEHEKWLKQYNEDKANIEKATVLAVLTEMEQFNSII